MLTAKEEVKAEKWKFEIKFDEEYQYQAKEDKIKIHKQEDNKINSSKSTGIPVDDDPDSNLNDSNDDSRN